MVNIPMTITLSSKHRIEKRSSSWKGLGQRIPIIQLEILIGKLKSQEIRTKASDAPMEQNCAYFS
jgi:hypothetical protein